MATAQLIFLYGADQTYNKVKSYFLPMFIVLVEQPTRLCKVLKDLTKCPWLSELETYRIVCFQLKYPTKVGGRSEI